jgi:predicted LPLAT superfamily acyltransferase
LTHQSKAQANNWDGKSKGNKLGYAIFIQLIKIGGIQSAYFLLQWVAWYYILFRKDVTTQLFNMYHNRLGYDELKSKKMIRKNIIAFGQSIIDKIVVNATQSENQFIVHRPGEEAIKAMADAGQGGILLSAHLGNYEMSGALLKRYDHVYNIVMYDGEDAAINAYMQKAGADRKFNVIYIKEDLSHIYEMSAALRRNEFICMHADRFLPGNRIMSHDFLNKTAHFPLGPFALASKLRAPVSFVFALKNDKQTYTFYATPAKVYEGRGMEGANTMLQEYVAELTSKLKQYPEQWFNYFDFWQSEA